MAVCLTAGLTLVLLLLYPAISSARPLAVDDLETDVRDKVQCEVISLTEEPSAPPQPTEPPMVPQTRPVPPVLPVVPQVPNTRYPLLLPSRGAVVAAQSAGGWVVPVGGLYPAHVLIYPGGNPQDPNLGQVPMIYGGNLWNSGNAGSLANVNPLAPLFTAHRGRGPHALGGRGRRQSSEEHDD
ncbi:hypothetical protein AMEX_G10313 [Astyanax mexicanus]|uniref:Uncharacterized protein n=1 Tax=Astyanax mexicanus TaxID=7994 RepID=A0A8T2LU01_ASTMX|nr:hypothetical protein AMEX_G10313 [Astyanax mexicanus]